MSNPVGRPIGQFKAKKDKLLFLLQNAPDLRKATNQKLGELLDVGRNQVAKYLNALEKENKITRSKRTLSFPIADGNDTGFFVEREIIVTTEETDAIF